MNKQKDNHSKKQIKKYKKLQKDNMEKKRNQNKAAPQDKQEESQDADIDFNQLQQGQQVQQMEVGFIVGEIQDSYYHSLKTILLRYAQITKTTNSELADAVIQNKAIGNVILADDDQEDEDQEQEDEDQQDEENDEENVYSVFSIFSGQSKLNKKLRSFVLKIIEKKDFPQNITTILKDSTTSVILNERLANLPAFVVNSALEVFKKQMVELKVKQPKKYKQIFGGYLLNISEIQFEGEQDLQKLIYSKFEDFEMCKRAMVWWLGEKNHSFKKKADMRNLYYLIKAQEYLQGIDQIKTYLEQ